MLMRNIKILEIGCILFSFTMMGNPCTPEDTEILLKIIMGFKEKRTQREKMKKLARWMSGGRYQLGFVLEKKIHLSMINGASFASVRLKKHSC